MSKSQRLKGSDKRPLQTCAGRQLVVRLERSIPGYEHLVDRRTRVLDLVSKPDELRRTEIQQLLVNKGDEDQQNQQDLEDPHIKEEQIELGTVPRPTKRDEEDCGGSDSDFPELEREDSDKDWDPSDLHKRINALGKEFSCSLCGKNFAQRQSLRYHLKTHIGEKPFSCSVCHKRFMQKGNLKYHMVVHSGERPYSCDLCSRTFRWAGQVKDHKCESSERCWKEPKKSLSCSKCNETFPDRLLLAAHKKVHQEKKLLSCSVCSFQARFRSQLQIHMRKHTGEKPYSCTICGKRFSQIGITKQHMLVHAKVKPFSCTVCGKRFSWHFQIKRHKCRTRFWQYSGSPAVWNLDPDKILKLRTEKRTEAKTEIADSDSTFWKETRRHQLGFTYQRSKKASDSDREPKIKKKITNCPDVKTENKHENGDVCSQNRHLQSNRQTHENSGNHSDAKLLYSESQRALEDRNSQQTHLRHSTAEKPFHCSACGKGFSNGGYLAQHMSIHTGEKLLSCLICKKTFSEELELISHECVGESSQRHQTQKQFSYFRRHPRCSVCNAGFSDRDSLVQHMRSHTRQTQFRCSVCGKDFAWRRHLTKHMENHVKKKLYRCSICCRKFTCPKKLSQHWCVHRSSQLQHSGSADGENCREPEQNPLSQADAENKAADSSDADTDDSDCWKENRRAQFTSEKHHKVPESDTTLHRKTLIQHLTGGQDLNRHTEFHTEIQREEEQEELMPTNIKEEQKEPVPTDIKEEQKEPLPTDNKEEQEGLVAIKEEQEDTDITKFTFSSVPMKTEEVEEKPQPSQLQQNNSAGQPEPDPDLDSNFGGVYNKSDDSVDSDFWKDTRQRQSGNDSGRNLFSSSDETNPQPESDDSIDSDFWKDSRNSQLGSNPLKHSAVRDDAKEKPYSCTECGKTFLYVFHMKTHMKLHTEERPFFCSVCGQKCRYKSHLKIHMRTHTGEKPFVCPICGKKYAHKASMQSHMTEHEKHYSCSVCDRSFAWYTELKYHQCVRESSHDQT